MAATETRLLLLGAALIFEPVNGYQIRRELLSWGVEEWANVQPGSIYNGLATLTQRGELVRHDLRDGGREVAVYELSDAGRVEFRRLYEEGLTQVRPFAPVAFQTTLSMLNLVTREDALRLLRTRLDNLDALAEGHLEKAALADRVPPHVHEIIDLGERTRVLERDWVQGLVGRIEAGALDFAGESRSWSPADDDPGWQMHDDRERYRSLLGR